MPPSAIKIRAVRGVPEHVGNDFLRNFFTANFAAPQRRVLTYFNKIKGLRGDYF